MRLEWNVFWKESWIRNQCTHEFDAIHSSSAQWQIDELDISGCGLDFLVEQNTPVAP
jgi:hypothetical protein